MAVENCSGSRSSEARSFSAGPMGNRFIAMMRVTLYPPILDCKYKMGKSANYFEGFPDRAFRLVCSTGILSGCSVYGLFASSNAIHRTFPSS